jgi:nucleoside phosphorylase
MKPKVGVPIAFDLEAWWLLGVRPWKGRAGRAVCTLELPSGVEIVALRSGVGIERGLEGARWLAEEGVRLLVSAGVACGLRPDMEKGDLVVTSRIMEEGDGEEPGLWESNPVFAKVACECLLEQGIPARQGTIVSVKTPLSTPEQKAELCRKTNGLVSDMESSSIARAAAEANLPFLALRVVIDSAREILDPDLSRCLDETGKVCLPLLGRNLCRRPSLAPEAARMTRDLIVALSVLRRAWAAFSGHALPDLMAGDGGRACLPRKG